MLHKHEGKERLWRCVSNEEVPKDRTVVLLLLFTTEEAARYRYTNTDNKQGGGSDAYYLMYTTCLTESSAAKRFFAHFFDLEHRVSEKAEIWQSGYKPEDYRPSWGTTE
ncbi:MAG: hypothetical protein C9356_20140 [Oleiphilus sp.]|nr:MAG: hypothetical protein C9356_20140 [Oleiphilus sp.]